MKSLPRIYSEKKRRLIMAAVLLSAFVLRLTVMLLTISTPGDGPARATRAYAWSQSPFFRSRGHWLRGYEYFAGLTGFLFDDPLLASRLLNVILGTLTILAFYLVIRKVYDPVTAVISAVILACFPLHIGLSASSFSEIAFSCEIISGTLFLIMAAESETAKSRALCLAFSLFLLCLGTMTRYEAWVLIPAFPVYYLGKTKRVSHTVVIALVLLAFPFLWTLNNYFSTGAFFGGFTGATGWRHGAKPVDLFSALRLLGGETIYHLGWIVPVLAAIGVAQQIYQMFKRTIAMERILYFFMSGIIFAGVFAYALARGAALYDRLLLFAFVMSLPFAALPLASAYQATRDRRQPVVAIFLSVAILASVVYKAGAYESLLTPTNHFYVTLWRPTEMKNLAEWLKKSAYREASLLMTPLKGQASYLFFYFPEAGSRRLIVKQYSKDTEVLRFLRVRRPALLITSDENGDAQTKIEGLLGTTLEEHMVVHRENHIKVYDIRSAVSSKKF